MSQIADLFFILFVVILAVRQFPEIAATVSRALRRGPTAEAADESRMPPGKVMKVCERCQTASPLHARFCSQCGNNLLPYVN
ncbi:MAG TPA: hypothetical protein VHG53_05290 [Candidatus Limnocylindria bacterium]|nr:hypothetical protein [Candidatus Limnocylindria bacterium]